MDATEDEYRAIRFGGFFPIKKCPNPLLTVLDPKTWKLEVKKTKGEDKPIRIFGHRSVIIKKSIYVHGGMFHTTDNGFHAEVNTNNVYKLDLENFVW